MIDRTNYRGVIALAAWGVAAVWILGGRSHGQPACEPGWRADFETPAINGPINDALEWDPDGAGPLEARVFAGGEFTSARGVELNHVAQLLDNEWVPVGEGFDGDVLVLAVHDFDGAGPLEPELVAGGAFTMSGRTATHHIARFDGSDWQPVGEGLDGEVRALTTFGGALIAGGVFSSTQGGLRLNAIGAFDGAWSALAGGVSGHVNSLTVYDRDDAGPIEPELIAAGLFPSASGVAVDHVARWDGASFSPLALGVVGEVLDVVTYDPDGAGPLERNVVIHGDFEVGLLIEHLAHWSTQLPGWQGVSLVPLCSSLENLAIGPGGEETLVVTWEPGAFKLVGTPTSAGDWRLDLEPLVADRGFIVDGVPRGTAEFSEGALVFGAFGSLWLGGEAAYLVAVAGANVVPLGPVNSKGPDGTVRALLSIDEPGPLPKGLYIGGDFTRIGGVNARRIARWDGAIWHPVGDLEDFIVNTVELAPFGNEPMLLAGGRDLVPQRRANVQIWNGRSWEPMESFEALENANIRALKFFPPRGTVYAAGYGNRSSLWSLGGRWNTILSNSPGRSGARALSLFEDAGGAQYLLVGGMALDDDPVGLLRIDEDDRESEMGDMRSWEVTALASPHPRIVFAARRSTTAPTVHEVVRWDGAAWQPIAPINEFNGPILAMEFHDPDGPGPMSNALIAGGAFSVAGGVDTTNLAMWDGLEWRAMDGGTNGDVLALASHKWSQLWVSGRFNQAGGVSSALLARRDSCVCKADCDESTGAGVLDVFDFLCFQDAFASGDASADCDGNGRLDIFDFLCFQSAFARGCS